MDLGARAGAFTVLIRDRAGQFTDTFDAMLADAGITVVKTPARCPRANAIAERWIRTLRAELTDRMLILGPRHVCRVLVRIRTPLQPGPTPPRPRLTTTPTARHRRRTVWWSQPDSSAALR